jgi:small-conductance mechanosensitive channel
LRGGARRGKLAEKQDEVEPMLDRMTLIYLACVGGAGLFLVTLLQLYFRRAERQRKVGVEQLKRFVAVKTASSELNRPGEEARETALGSIETRFAMIRRLTIPAVLLVTALLLGAPFFGRMPATMATLLVTAFTVILGIAGKPVLENVIAGVMISFSQPLRIGDLVLVEKQYGIIEQINLTYTVLKLWDWRRYVIPNTRLLQLEYFNYTLMDRWQWAYVSFWAAYDADMDKVRELALAAVNESPYSVKEHATGFWIIEMNKEGVVCWVAGWVDHPLEAWGLRHDISMRLISAFKEHGIRAHVYQHESQGQMPAPPPPVNPAEATA